MTATSRPHRGNLGRLSTGSCVGIHDRAWSGSDTSVDQLQGWGSGRIGAFLQAAWHRLTWRAAVVRVGSEPAAQLLARVAADVVARLVDQATVTALEVAVLLTFVACARRHHAIQSNAVG